MPIQRVSKAPASPPMAECRGGLCPCAALVKPFGTLWFIYLLPFSSSSAGCFAGACRPGLAVTGPSRDGTGPTPADRDRRVRRRFIYFHVGYLAGPLPPRAFARAGRQWPRLRAPRACSLYGRGINAAAVATGAVGALAVGISLALGLRRCRRWSSSTAALSWLRFRRRSTPCASAGENRIVVYLAFFLPMAVTRTVLLKTGIVADVGSWSLSSSPICGVAGALAIWRGARKRRRQFPVRAPGRVLDRAEEGAPTLQAAE